MPHTEEHIDPEILSRGTAPGFISPTKAILGGSLLTVPFAGVLGGLGALGGGLLGSKLHHAYPKLKPYRYGAPIVAGLIGAIAGKQMDDRRREREQLLRKYLYNLPG